MSPTLFVICLRAQKKSQTNHPYTQHQFMIFKEITQKMTSAVCIFLLFPKSEDLKYIMAIYLRVFAFKLKLNIIIWRVFTIGNSVLFEPAFAYLSLLLIHAAKRGGFSYLSVLTLNNTMYISRLSVFPYNHLLL